MKSNNNIQSKAVNIGIYEIINNVNGKKYFGQTKYTIKKRFNEHCTSPYPIGCAIRKYGPENFSRKLIIKNIDSQDAANDIETHLIKEFDTLATDGHGYNIASGGYGNPFAGMSEEKKKKKAKKQSEKIKGKPAPWVSVRMKGNVPWNKGIPSPFKGIKKGPQSISENTRAAMSKAKKGKPSSKRTKFTQEETDFLLQQKTLGLSIPKITKSFNEKFNKNILIGSIIGHIKRSLNCFS